MKMLSVKLPRPFRLPGKYIRKSSYAASESQWQSKWQAEAASAVINNHLDDRSSKFYMLSMFPYPSGRLHMGHVRVYTISDTVARFHRMKGKKVLHPMGWDSFGLPAENAAIDRGIHPAQWTEDNISTMRDQLNLLGCQFDWHRELSTCSPDYYKWSQWLFLQLYKNGLAYKKKAYVNWDPVDQTVLANEQVDSDGCSWRSGAKVEQRYLDQWFFKTTHYAEALLQGLDELDWPNQVKLMQADWIGKSQGAYFDFKLQEVDWTPLKVFTTRADTLFGVSYLAISTEHDLLQNTKLFSSSVLQAVEELRNISKIADNETSKKGFPLGLNVIHPLTGDSIPVYVADYVIGDYGTKAVMGVPAHDERDLLFANEHGLPIVSVIDENEGRLVRSEQFSGMFVEEGRQAIIDHAASMGVSGHMTQYKLRDWLISRQRYWGAPIPIVYCEKCGTIPVSEQSLPVMLPSDVKFCGRGPSPLTQTTSWLRTTCGKSGCCAWRETDTMDTFVDSSWYFLRYINPDDSTRPFRTEDANIWMPVNVYVGGIEHAILHLIYARFITHFLHDIGAVNVKEPFQKILTQGMVQGRTHRIKRTGRYLQPEELEEARSEGEEISVSWEKMSKSKYNGVDPEGIIKEYGADTVRLFMLFKAPSDLPIEWDTKAIAGVHRWLGRVESLVQNHIVVCRMEKHSSGERQKKEVIESAVHKAIKESTIFYEEHKYNKVLPELMILSNLLRDSENGTPEFQNALTTLCILLAPMAPHFASEMWEHLREAARCLDTQMTKDAVLDQQWPTYRADLLQEDTVLLVITMNGKKVGTVSVPSELTQTHKHSELESKAKQLLQDKGKLRNGVNIERVVVVPDRGIVNFVTKR